MVQRNMPQRVARRSKFSNKEKNVDQWYGHNKFGSRIDTKYDLTTLTLHVFKMSMACVSPNSNPYPHPTAIKYASGENLCGLKSCSQFPSRAPSWGSGISQKTVTPGPRYPTWGDSTLKQNFSKMCGSFRQFGFIPSNDAHFAQVMYILLDFH